MTEFTALDAGCWFDSHRGQYIGEAVQDEADDRGWSGWFTPCEHDPGMYMSCSEHSGDFHGVCYDEATQEAEDYLNDMAPEGFYFGSNPDSGDWGLWAIDEDDDSGV